MQGVGEPASVDIPLLLERTRWCYGLNFQQSCLGGWWFVKLMLCVQRHSVHHSRVVGLSALLQHLLASFETAFATHVHARLTVCFATAATDMYLLFTAGGISPVLTILHCFKQRTYLCKFRCWTPPHLCPLTVTQHPTQLTITQSSRLG